MNQYVSENQLENVYSTTKETHQLLFWAIIENII